RTAAAEPRPAPSHGRNGRRRHHAMAGGAVRRRPPRCSLLVDGGHPPPSRHPLAQRRRRHRRAPRPATSAGGQGERAHEAGWHSHLLHLLARTGGRDRDHPQSPRSHPEPAPPADLGGWRPPVLRGGGGRRRPAGPAPPPPPPPTPPGRAPQRLPRP